MTTAPTDATVRLPRAKQEIKDRKQDFLDKPVGEKGHHPAFFSLSAAAQLLGVDKSTLCRLRAKHPLYAPAVKGVPGNRDIPLGSRITLFSEEQILLIRAVFVGAMDIEEAGLRWRIAQENMRRRAEAVGMPAEPERGQR